MYFAGVGFWIYAIVELNEFDSPKLLKLVKKLDRV